MARQSEILAQRFLQALRTEKNSDVGILDEITHTLQTQNDALEQGQKDEAIRINHFADDLIKQINDMRDGCLKESSEMYSALFTVNRILLDKIKAHISKVNSDPILELLPQDQKLVDAGATTNLDTAVVKK